MRSRRPGTHFDPLTARLAAMNVGLLPLVVRPVEPITVRDFDNLITALAVLLAVAERRRAAP
jgi:hypothetical protein